jgi:hypothetical protein
MTGDNGVPHVHGAKGTRGSGFTPGFGLSTDSPLRVACPKCSAGIGRKCVKVDRYGLEWTAAVIHPARTAAARAVAVVIVLYPSRDPRNRR